MTTRDPLTTDERWMKEALRLAESGKGRTSPNPMVGAVLVKGDRVVGKGYHAKAGSPHAEVLALQEAGRKANGSVLYVNIEPCTHFGRTPPCAPRVIEAQLKRVVVGMEDPNPHVQGRGIRSLRKAGIEIEVGVLEGECRKLNEAFCKHISGRGPFVVLKVASTLDGKIASRSGDSKWITGEIARRFVHRLRSEVDGVLVGIGTVLKDDPRLTARIPGGRDPYRIVLDSRLTIPEGAKIFGRSPSKVIIVTTRKGSREKRLRLERRGVRVFVLGSTEGRVDLRACLKKLGSVGIMALMVEGGSRVNGSFLDQGAVDKFYAFLSPKWMGDPDAPGVFGGRGAAGLKGVIRLRQVRWRRMGEDLLVEGYVEKGGRRVYGDR